MLQLIRHPLYICAFLSIVFYLPYVMASPNGTIKRDGLHVPCTFFDTVNVTGDPRLSNGSYNHSGIIIPEYLVGQYDYVYTDLVSREKVELHYRGCVCKLRPCINLCCPWGYYFNVTLSICMPTDSGYQWPESVLNVTLGNHSVITVDIFKQFAVQDFRPCKFMYPLTPEINGPDDDWAVFENATLFRAYDSVYFSKSDYCLVPTIINETDTFYVINPANCNEENEYSTMKVINAYAMLFSIPFMALTIFVYLAIPELRNHHGKSLVCYLIGLTVGYSLLASNQWISTSDLIAPTCKIIGYTAYYFFMAAFFWLSVISFDLWHNFRCTRGVNRFQEKKRFLIYSLYSWGAPLFFLVFTWYAQEYAPIADNLKPGIGGGEFCWLDMRTWSAMIYFFAPIVLIILANTVMFIMTALKIHKVQREMARIMAREDSTKNLRTEKDKFGLFLRLFIVMGVTWSLEIISYFVGPDKSWSKIFYVSDICNAIQGFLIFMLFVMKKKVKHLISNRILKRKPSGTSNTNSTNSTTSDFTQHPDKYAMKMKPPPPIISNKVQDVKF